MVGLGGDFAIEAEQALLIRCEGLLDFISVYSEMLHIPWVCVTNSNIDFILLVGIQCHLVLDDTIAWEIREL